jgi:hypothetical protein
MVNPFGSLPNKELTNFKKDMGNYIHKNKHNKADSNHPFKMCHHNIRGLKYKLTELSNFINIEAPHVVFLSEHHLKEYNIKKINMKQYVQRANFCRQSLKNGGVCIFIYETITYSIISLQEQCKEQDI